MYIFKNKKYYTIYYAYDRYCSTVYFLLKNTTQHLLKEKLKVKSSANSEIPLYKCKKEFSFIIE